MSANRDRNRELRQPPRYQDQGRSRVQKETLNTLKTELDDIGDELITLNTQIADAKNRQDAAQSDLQAMSAKLPGLQKRSQSK